MHVGPCPGPHVAQNAGGADDPADGAAEVAGRLDRPRDREAAWKRLSTDFPDHPLTLKLALDFGSAAFKQKSWKSAATYATLWMNRATVKTPK